MSETPLTANIMVLHEPPQHFADGAEPTVQGEQCYLSRILFDLTGVDGKVLNTTWLETLGDAVPPTRGNRGCTNLSLLASDENRSEVDELLRDIPQSISGESHSTKRWKMSADEIGQRPLAEKYLDEIHQSLEQLKKYGVSATLGTCSFKTIPDGFEPPKFLDDVPPAGSACSPQ